ncbi:MAG: beta-galactosidase [Christensenellaceae bacterium]
MAWNLHEPQKGKLIFGNMRPRRILRLPKAAGLLIVRPVYICAEWDGGGLPCWLLADGCALRCSDKKYLSHVKEYFGVLCLN